MEKAAERPSGEICHRCLQPIAPSAQTCPNCGERHSPRNRLPIILGVLGLLALVFVAIIMIKVIQNSDIDTAPPDQTQSDDGAPQPQQPEQPEKPPPFNP